MDVPVENLKTEVEAELQKRPSISGPGTEAGKIYVTQRLNRVLIKAEEEAKRLKDEYVSVEHLALALMDEGTGIRKPGASLRISTSAGIASCRRSPK
jgi:ATP-dependent Clp protease ATP-binding subunit ClpB